LFHPPQHARAAAPRHWPPNTSSATAREKSRLVERVDVQEDALEIRIRAEGLASLAGELRQDSERRAA
jgi:hypothetical protein